MCGIIGAWGNDPAKHVLEQYNKQWNRGTDGFGFIALKNNRIVQFARATKEDGIRAQLRIATEHKPDAILFHHRWPTSTINVVEAAHPLPLTHEKWRHNYYVLHNGVISGADDEIETIEKKGYTFQSRVSRVSMYRAGKTLYEITEESEVNDSEVLGFYMAEYLEGKRKDMPVFGPIAVIMVQQSKKTGHCRVFFMRNYGNPLQIERKKKEGVLIVASEANGAMIPAHRVHKLTRSLTLHAVAAVEIGKSYAQPVDYEDRAYAGGSGGAYESDGQGGWRRIGFKTETPSTQQRAPLLPAKGEEAVIDKAIETAKNAADLAYTDFQEAQALLDATMGESERAELETYIEELRATWVQREEEYEDLLEENGKEYDYSRNTDGVEAVSG